MINIQQQINEIAVRFLKQFHDNIRMAGSSASVKGLWLFRLNEDVNRLEYWSIVPTTIADAKKQLIKRVQIAYGEGSIGHAVLRREIAVIEKTADDPRGVVSVVDQSIGQKSAVCYPIYEGNKLLCVLDYFGENFIKDDEKTYRKAIEKFVDDNSKKELLLLNEVFAYARLQNLLMAEKEIAINTSADLLKLAHQYINEVTPNTLTTFSENNNSIKEADINMQYVNGVVREEIEWCSYLQGDRLACDTCVVNHLSSLRCPFCISPGTAHKLIDSIPGYKVIYKLLKDTESEYLKLSRFEKALNQFIKHSNFKKLRDKNKDELIDIVIAELLNSAKDEQGGRSILRQLLKHYKLGSVTIPDDCIKKTQIEYLIVYREEENGWTWRPGQNISILDLKSDLKKLAVIRAIYAGFQPHTSHIKYPVPLGEEWHLKYQDQNKIVITQDRKISKRYQWQWQRGTRNKVISVTINKEKLGSDLISHLFKKNTSIQNLLKSLSDEKHHEIPITALNKYTFHIYSRQNISNISHIRNNIQTYLDHICGLYQATQEQINSTRHAHKSAVVAIMSRNLSHNVGSHVLSYWNQELSKSLPQKADLYRDKDIAISKSKDLFQYIQQRMDFLAELSTSVPCSEVSLDIQNDILSPVLSPFGGSALLKYLAHSEDIDLHGRVIVEIDKSVKSSRVSIPNGLIGAHGIYSILENFIRNAAKHYRGKSKVEELIKIVIKEPLQPSLRDKYLVMRIWDMRPNSCDRNTLIKLRQYLPRGKKCHFTEEGRLSPEGWGLKEMITSANFLRKYEPEMLLRKLSKGTPSLIEILCGDSRDRPLCEIGKDGQCCHSKSKYKKRLGIRLYLMKPKDLAVSVSSSIEIKKNSFAIEAIRPLHQEIPHRILLVDNKVDAVKYEADPRMPCRIMVHNKLAHVIDDDYYLFVYEDFIKKRICLNTMLPQLTYQGTLKGGGGGFFIKRGESQKIPDSIKEYYYKAGDEEWSWNNTKKNELLITTQPVLIYYHHAESPSERRNLRQLVDNDLYVQPVSGGYSTQAKLTSIGLLPAKLQKHFSLELIEAALTKIIIIDERVSEWAIGSFNGIEKKKILQNMNIYIPEVALSDISMKHIASTLKNLPNVHFVVVHQGILDKMENKKKNSSKLFMKNILSTKCQWRVVDSGRGVPSNLFADARFVEISSLLKMLQEYDKHGLIQSLYSSRHPQNSTMEPINGN